MEDQVFDRSLMRGLGDIRGLGQDGGLTSVSGYDADGNPLPAASGLLNPSGDGTDSGDGTNGGGGGGGAPAGGGGGGAVTPSGGGGGGATTTPGAASSASTALSQLAASVPGGNTGLIIGAIAVVGGIAGIAYLAHRKTVQGGGRSLRRSRR
jgi:hypothetical protein